MPHSHAGRIERLLPQFQQNCEAVLRPELRKNKEIEHFSDSVKTEVLYSV